MCGDGGRGWGGTAMGPGVPRVLSTARSREGQAWGLPPPPAGAGPASTLNSDSQPPRKGGDLCLRGLANQCVCPGNRHSCIYTRNPCSLLPSCVHSETTERLARSRRHTGRGDNGGRTGSWVPAGWGVGAHWLRGDWPRRAVRLQRAPARGRPVVLSLFPPLLLGGHEAFHKETFVEEFGTRGSCSARSGPWPGHGSEAPRASVSSLVPWGSVTVPTPSRAQMGASG